MKRLLAYSSVGQLGYIVLGFSLATREGVTSSVIHVFNHAIIKGGLFMALGCVALRLGGTDLRHMRGLGKRMPWTAGALTIGGMGLIGFPLTSGFISKWYLLQAVWALPSYWNVAAVAVVVIGGTILAGGRGGVWGTLAGVMIFSLIDSIFNLAGVDAFAKQILRGIIIVTAVALYASRSKRLVA